MVRISGQSVVVALVVVVALSSTGNAQTLSLSASESQVGFTGGLSVDPEQGFVGVFWQSPEIGSRFHVRPGIDGGFGDNLKLATINIDFVVRFPIGASGWDFIQGGGPAVVIAKYDLFGLSETDVSAGGSYIIGFGHESGLLGEFRIGGGGNVPNLKFTAGYGIAF